MKYFPDGCSDIEVIIKNKRPSRSNICSGYRPAFKIKDDYLTTGIIKLVGVDELQYDDETMAEIWLLSPEFYPNCLKVGQVIQFQEGQIIHGFATITKVKNKDLEIKWR